MKLKAVLFATVLTLSALPALAFGQQDFDAREVTIDGIVGRLEIKVDSSVSKVTANVSGPERWLETVSVKLDGDDLRIVQKDHPWERYWRDKDGWVTVQLTVPVGTRLDIDDFSGEGMVGDLRGALSVDGMSSGSLKVGRVTTAKISIDGSGDITLGDVDRDVNVEINGSGSVKTGRTAGKAELEINGSGEIDLANVNGPIDAEINGSGDINIHGGVADPLAVEINGSGSVLMDGVARNHSVEQLGSGKVRITGKAG